MATASFQQLWSLKIRSEGGGASNDKIYISAKIHTLRTETEGWLENVFVDDVVLRRRRPGGEASSPADREHYGGSTGQRRRGRGQEREG